MNGESGLAFTIRIIGSSTGLAGVIPAVQRVFINVETVVVPVVGLHHVLEIDEAPLRSLSGKIDRRERPADRSSDVEFQIGVLRFAHPGVALEWADVLRVHPAYPHRDGLAGEVIAVVPRLRIAHDADGSGFDG